MKRKKKKVNQYLLSLTLVLAFSCFTLPVAFYYYNYDNFIWFNSIINVFQTIILFFIFMNTVGWKK